MAQIAKNPFDPRFTPFQYSAFEQLAKYAEPRSIEPFFQYRTQEDSSTTNDFNDIAYNQNKIAIISDIKCFYREDGVDPDSLVEWRIYALNGVGFERIEVTVAPDIKLPYLTNIVTPRMYWSHDLSDSIRVMTSGFLVKFDSLTVFPSTS